ncbi:hypothetical protein HJG60_010948 [Phyllostomus discolor]|uniref:Uncharacterized protein n=1 Tax=Phyllostomus discolor TaxID=89673 RepID=A0A834ACD4_9CHIR|nr:hypothetical protein HJG60_010948 [Phyllostomus discolor]
MCLSWLAVESNVNLVVYDPDYMKVILGRSDPESHSIYRFLASWIGCGMLLLNGQTWFQHWWMLTPAFHYDILNPYVGIMVDSVRVMLSQYAIMTVFWLVGGFQTGVWRDNLALSAEACWHSSVESMSPSHHRTNGGTSSANSHLEIFEHVSLMTLDTIMKCSFSQQGSVQTDRSQIILQLQNFVSIN